MDNAKNKQQGNDTALMIEGLYNGIAYDLQKLRKELLNELKLSSLQTTSLYETFKSETGENAANTVAACKDVKKSVDEAQKTIAEEVKAAGKEMVAGANEAANSVKATADTIALELKFGYQQNQTIFETLSGILNDEVLTKINTVEEKLVALEKVDEAIAVLNEKLEAFKVQEEVDFDAVAETIKEKVVAALPENKVEIDAEALAETVKDKVVGAILFPEEIDVEKLVADVAEKTEATAAVHSKEVLDAVAAIPVAENVDYTRIVEEVSDSVLEKITEFCSNAYSDEKLASFATKGEEIDYDKVIYGVTEKVVESLPYPEKVDYARIEEAFVNKAPVIDEAALIEKIANAVLEKIPQPEPVDYDVLAEKIAEKLAPQEIDYDLLAEKVAEKIVVPQAEPVTYDVVVDEEGAQAIADKVVVPQPEKVEIDYAILAAAIAAQSQSDNASYEVLIDENGANMIAEAVAEKLKGVEVKTEEPVQEETVEEVIEEVVETVEETPVVEEIATTDAFSGEIDYDDANQLVDAENGLVMRLKRSFTAKLKQNTPEVKSYYSMIKNELASYKRLNSNVSWHGDRFNFGRDTVARMSINGKTLCFYVALDPANPDYKTTVYHQKDLSGQKAYEATPFMMKIKSETGAKKAVRLIGILAEKLGAVKNEKYEPVDYVEQFEYASTKELVDEGLI
ncbi:MAG: hypothetical protein IIX01_05870, partial [Clostridia bacterium]|nr:hypothetical protein [Clostridia bacterium]